MFKFLAYLALCVSGLVLKFSKKLKSSKKLTRLYKNTQSNKQDVQFKNVKLFNFKNMHQPKKNSIKNISKA